MALEAVIFSQDPFLGCYFKDLFSTFGSLNFDPCGSNPQLYQDVNFNGQWDQFTPSNNNSPPQETCTATVEGRPSHYGGFPTAEIPDAGAGDEAAVGRRKRRRRTTKNKEEVENQRMTHIAVERNRRKQMNEYLAVIRSLMPSSYVQRGDQASIIGGAINYVKELEQVLQSLEAQKTSTTSTPSSKQQQAEEQDENHCNRQEPEPVDVSNDSSRAPFSGFFSIPQHSRRRGDEAGTAAAAEEIEVNMADSHANVKILIKRKPKQLLQLVAGFQALRLGVLHVNVTTLDALALYSFSLKVEEGCQLSSVEEIVGAANHILGSN